MKNWRTTVGGVLAAVGTVVVLCPIPHAQLIGAALAGLGQVFLGLTAQDSANGKKSPAKGMQP